MNRNEAQLMVRLGHKFTLEESRQYFNSLIHLVTCSDARMSSLHLRLISEWDKLQPDAKNAVIHEFLDIIESNSEDIDVSCRLLLQFGIIRGREHEKAKNMEIMDQCILQLMKLANNNNSNCIIYNNLLSLFSQSRALKREEVGKYADAIHDYTVAIESQPNYALPLNYRGELYAKIKERSLALLDLNKSIAMDPCISSAYIFRGNLYYDMNEFEKAAEDYSRSIEINRESPCSAYYNRSLIYEQCNKYVLALADSSISYRLKSTRKYEQQYKHCLKQVRIRSHNACALFEDEPFDENGSQAQI